MYMWKVVQDSTRTMKVRLSTPTATNDLTYMGVHFDCYLSIFLPVCGQVLNQDRTAGLVSTGSNMSGSLCLYGSGTFFVAFQALWQRDGFIEYSLPPPEDAVSGSTVSRMVAWSCFHSFLLSWLSIPLSPDAAEGGRRGGRHIIPSSCIACCHLRRRPYYRQALFTRSATTAQSQSRQGSHDYRSFHRG